jgi:uncharacterized membrane protein YcaP (DUF421 family)
MESVLRAAAIYLFLMVLFRITGRRSLAQMTPFDLVLLLVVAEATQQGLLGNDFSVTNAFVVILTLIGMEVLFTFLTNRSRLLNRWINDVPLILIEDGRVIDDRLQKARVSMEDILEQARMTQGIERVEQIKYAVLERSGGVSTIPRQQG